jgi:hypothetical protein
MAVRRGTSTCLPPGPTAPDRLRDGESLIRGQHITSPDGRFTLEVQAQDGNLVLYEYGKRPLWASGVYDVDAWVSLTVGALSMRDQRNGVVGWGTNPANDGSPSTLVLQDDGNLVLYRNSDRAVIWTTNTYGK